MKMQFELGMWLWEGIRNTILRSLREAIGISGSLGNTWSGLQTGHKEQLAGFFSDFLLITNQNVHFCEGFFSGDWRRGLLPPTMSSCIREFNVVL